MNVIVGKHAIERFLDWRRTTTLDVDPEKAERTLARAALKGRVVKRFPGGVLEVEHRGMYLAVKKKGKDLVVVTFNGDRVWRGWYRKQHRAIRHVPKSMAAL